MFYYKQERHHLMRMLALDLEMNQPSNKIIQIGYCVGNAYTLAIEDHGCWYVNPNEPIEQRIFDLTGISDYRVQTDGIVIRDAYDLLINIFLKYKCLQSVVTWGGADHRLLCEQAGINPRESELGRSHFDLKKIMQTYGIAHKKTTKGGLCKIMENCGIRFMGDVHNAEHDAHNTMRLYFHVLERFRLLNL